jgi:hypothetical protein
MTEFVDQNNKTDKQQRYDILHIFSLESFDAISSILPYYHPSLQL